MTFRGPVEDIPESSGKDENKINIYKDDNGVQYQDGDVIAVTHGKYAEIEFVLWEGEWVELGDTSAAHKAIAELQASVGALQEYAESNHIEKTYTVTASGWYRIAKVSGSTSLGSTYNNLVQLYSESSTGGYKNVTLFATSGSITPVKHDKENIPEITPIISSHYQSKPVNKIRIQYVNNTEKVSEAGYLEIYVALSSSYYMPITIKVKTVVNMGWMFCDKIEAVDTALPTGFDAVVQELNDLEENISVEAISESELKSILI